MVITDELLAEKLQSVLVHLDERQRRLVMGAEAKALGHGGIRRVAAAAGCQSRQFGVASGRSSRSCRGPR